MDSLNELKSRAAEIRDATDEGENTAYRVGSMLVDFVGNMEEVQDDVDEKLEALEGSVTYRNYEEVDGYYIVRDASGDYNRYDLRTNASFGLRIYTGFRVGTVINITCSNNSGSALAYAWYTTSDSAAMSSETAIAPSFTGYARAANTLHQETVPEGAVSLVVCLYTGADVTIDSDSYVGGRLDQAENDIREIADRLDEFEADIEETQEATDARIDNIESDVETNTSDIDSIKDCLSEYVERAAKSTTVGFLSRGSITLSGTQKGDLYAIDSGFNVVMWEVTAGETVRLTITSNTGTTALAGGWYSSSDIPSSTYESLPDVIVMSANWVDDMLEAEGGGSVNTANSNGEHTLVVPEGASGLAISLYNGATATLETRAMTRLEMLDEVEVELDKVDDINTLSRPNLFSATPYDADSLTGYIHEKIIDSSGNYADWVASSHINYSGVGVFPATYGKYYVIFNPYNPRQFLGAAHVNPIYNGMFKKNDTSNLVLSGNNITIAQCVWTQATDITSLQGMYFNLYYKLKASVIDQPSDFSMVEVYELDSVSDAIDFVRAKWGETLELGDSYNIERRMLVAGGTIGSVIGTQSCVVFGDSIAADHVWSEKVASALKMHEMYNLAIGGAIINGGYVRTFADDVSNTTYVDLIYQILSAPSKLFDVCEAFGEERTVTNQAGNEVTCKVKTIDNVIIAIGINNTGGVSYNPAGNLDTVLATPWEELLPSGWDWNNLDSNTTSFADLYSAIKYCLMLLRNRVITATVDNSTTYGLDFTSARIVWQTPVQRINTTTINGNVYIESPEVLVDGLTRIERIKRIEGIICDMCEALAVPVIIGRTMSGISAIEELEYYETDANGKKFIGKNLRDGVHMTAAGYDRLAEMHIRAMLGGGSSQLGAQQSGGSITIDSVPTQGSGNAVSSGGVYTALAGKQDTIAKGSVTITVSDWSGNTCTVTATGVTATNVVIVSPDSASMADYAAAGVQCTAQGTDTLTFTCTSTPTSSLTINYIAI